MSGDPTGRNDPAAAFRMRLELLRLLVRNNLPAAVALPVIGAIQCVLFAHWVDVLDLAAWLSVALIALTAFISTGYQLLRHEPAPDSLRGWTWALFGLGILNAGSWGAFGLVAWVPGDYLNNMLVFTFLCASIAAVASVQSASLLIAFGQLASYLVVFSLLSVSTEFWEHALHVAAFSVFTVFMGAVTYNNHISIRDVLTLREEKNDLIGALGQAKEDSDTARQKAEAASRAKSDFLANMSHELRTPLNAIIGFSELIKDEILGTGKAEVYCSYADDIHSSGHHLLGLINDILDLSKIEAGRYVVYDEPLLLSETVRDVVRLFKSRCEKQGVALSSELDGEPLLMADRRALKQILINLVGNAIKFTDASGSISVRAAERDGSVTISVADTGRGIAPEDLKHVFESFGQGRHDVTIRDKGTGLGLTIVKGLVAAHDGTIELDSTLGRGTTVTVVFPAERTLKPSRASQAA